MYICQKVRLTAILVVFDKIVALQLGIELFVNSRPYHFRNVTDFPGICPDNWSRLIYTDIIDVDQTNHRFDWL